MADLKHLFGKYKFDREKETEGVWHTMELGDGQTFECKIARNTTKAYKDRILTNIIPLLGQKIKQRQGQHDAGDRRRRQAEAAEAIIS